MVPLNGKIAYSGFTIDIKQLVPCVARTSANLKREKTKVISFRVPHNATVQIYNYKEKTPHVVFGPELMLRPNEQYTQLNFSGDSN